MPDTSSMRRSYAVTWRESDGFVQAGKLVLGSRSLQLDGGTLRGRLSAQRILYGDLAGVEAAQPPVERIGGRPTLVLKRVGRASLAIACLDGPGCLHELAERLGRAITDTVAA